jgi:Carboxypeptidase regulatory-like domain/TonB dependent receptor
MNGKETRLILGPCILLTAISFLFAYAPARAQNATGRIIGTATDAQGAAIAGARITITNTGTNVHWNTVSNADGFYQVLDLPVGTYSVSAERDGFSKVVTAPQELDINQALRIDMRMKVGSLSEVVKVEAQAAQVETVSPTIGGTVTGAPIQDLPLNGRNTLDLALTQPGVVPIADDLGTYGTGNGGSNGLGGISVAGGRGDAVTYLLDGGLNNRVTSNQVVFNPNPEAVEEFRLLENNYTAEYGRNGGGTITEVIKSGTNALHGSLYDFLRNDALNASDFFDNALGNPRPVLKRNQFGGTIGGPITLPRLVNGKDRFFFFFAYQGQRQTATVAEGCGAVATYTPAEITGDFSQAAADSSGNAIPDPSVAAFLQSHPYFQSNSALAAQAIIDPTKIDPVARKYLASGLIPASPSGQILSEGKRTDNPNQYLGKFDFYATQNDRISLTAGYSKEPVLNPFFGANVNGFSATSNIWDDFGNIGYTKTISATKLNEFHTTAQRWYATTVPASHPPVPSALGVSIRSDDAFGPPDVYFASGLSIGFDPNVSWKADNTYALTDTFTWNRGHHTWKFGGRFAIMQENSVYAYQTNGSFWLYGGCTSVGSGNDLADFLFGAIDEYYQASEAPSNEHQKQYGLFVQDEWKVTPRFTLTLGLRYEYTSPEKDKRGFSFTILPGVQSQRFVNAPTGLVFPGDPGAPTGWYFPDYKNLAPRVGFAWDPFGNGKTSLRGGFGMFYDTLNGWMSDWATDEPPFAGSADLFFNPSPAANTTMSDPYNTAGSPDPFPSQIPPPKTVDFNALGLIPFGNGNNNFVDPHLKTPYIYQYNLSVERQISNGLMAEIGYVGSSSHKLLTWLDANPFIPGTTNRILGSNFGYVTTFAGLNNANYNGLLTSLTKRESDVRYLGNVFFTLAYTWSHNLDNGSGFNSRNTQIASYNHHVLYGNSDFNVPQRLTFSGGWELPFARAWAGGPKRLTTGWSLYPIVFAQSGIPLDALAGLHESQSKPGPSGAGDREVVRADQMTSSIPTLDPHTLYYNVNGALSTTCPSGATCSGPNHYWFDPNDFSVPDCFNSPYAPGSTPPNPLPPNTAPPCPAATYGTFGRNSFRGPKHVNADLALEKSTNLVKETTKLIFRVEAFNVFNHTEFRPPSATSFASGTFGQITRTYDPRILQLALKLTF